MESTYTVNFRCEGGAAMSVLSRFAILAILITGLAATAMATDPSTYAYPMPSTTGVACVTCPDPYKNLPTWPYSSPIKRFVGRYLDSSMAREIQAPIRTLRARDAKIAEKNGRLYSIFGGSRFAAWNLNTLFTSDLGKPLNQLSSSQTFPELYLSWATYVDPDTDRQWHTVFVDGQQRLGMFDFDDRGYVYLPYGPYGWGIVQDTGGSFRFMSQVTDSPVAPGAALVMRSGAKYYTFIIDPSSKTKCAAFDVTTPASPTSLGVIGKAPQYWDKIDAGGDSGFAEDVVGLSTPSGVFEIYTASAFAGDRLPSTTIPASSGKYWTVTTDGTNFYVVRKASNGTFTVDTIGLARTGDATSYSVTASQPLPGDTLPGKIRWGAGYVTVMYYGATGADLKLFKVTDGVLKEIDLGGYFNKYYVNPPAGYAKPSLWTSDPIGGFVYHADGHDYLIYEGIGIGDVYEIQGGESVDVRVSTAAGYGTTNPNTPSTSEGPYVCDPITFTSTASTPMSLTWDFGNPESLDNTALATSGSAIVHQFAGYTTSSQITQTKTVGATSVNDLTVKGTVSVNLQLPSARVAVAGSALFVQPNSTPTVLVPGDLFADASDGSIEGHYGVWTIDGIQTTGTPAETQPAGDCGAHTLSFAAHYVPYDGAGATIVPRQSADYVSSVSNATYEVTPFVAGLKVDSYDASNVTFKNTARYGSASTFLAEGLWTEELKFVDAAGGVIYSTTKTSPIGTQDTFTVAKSAYSGATKAVLTITVDSASILNASCAGSGTVASSAEVPIAIPDPAITITGCDYVGSPCTLTASSVSNASTSSWSFLWKVNGASSGTLASINQTLSAPGTYTFEVTATNAFGSATAQQTKSVQAPLCVGAPPSASLSFGWNCTTCSANTSIKFTPYAFSPYTFQDCDSFSWTFGDGQSSTLKTPTHQFTKNGLYTVKLVVKNSNGSATLTNNVQIGTVAPPPPTCPSTGPTGIYLNLSAPSGCTTSSPNCKSGETISFSPAPWGYSLQTCDTYRWSFGDGTSSTSKTPSHVYASAGTYPVTLTVTNSKGSSISPAVNVTTSGGGGTNTCPNPPGQFMDMVYTGATSGCATASSTPCSVAETVSFSASSFGYVFQTCDSFSWNFGDNSSPASGKNVNHTFSAVGNYTVKITVTNVNGTSTGQRTIQVGGSGGTPAPEVNFTIGNSSPAVGTAVSFTGNVTSGGPIVSWNWNFGDGTTGSGQTVSHTYTTPGAKTVTLTAANSGNSAVVSKSITVADANSFAFLLPVVTHLDNEDRSKWQTDLQYFNPTPNFDPASPMVLSFEFKGQTKTLTFDKSTDLRKDFLNYLTTEKTSGSVIVRGTGDYPPQMWTRTYIVTPSGIGTYGQLIPAIPLTSQQAAGGVIPKQYLPGLHFGPKGSASKFRTNIGLVNPSAAAATITMGFLDKDGLPVGETFNTTVEPYSLIQVNDGAIRNSVPLIDPAKAYTVELTTTAAGLMAYASIVDNTSNDPVFVQAVSETEAASATRKVQVLPGLSHFNTPAGDSWRSDVVVYNADEHTIQFDMELLGTDGTKFAEAKGITLGGSQSLQLDDMLTTATPVPVPAGAQAGTLRLTTSIGTEFPIMYSRTYNDRSEAGTFGQGIPAFSGTEGNVSVDKPAYIAGVRSNSSYYTNLGLVSASDTASTVSVKMLEPIRGTVIGEQTFTVNPGQSLIVGSANSDFLHALAPGMDELGTLQIEVTAGGNVWAFVSIIDKLTKDPEYVPATPAN